ncbi:MAG: hypothetical protein IPH57_17070 [Saprospiraceae bacterium]|nr:hypothetical protein [Saprospiraceae bacterium]
MRTILLSIVAIFFVSFEMNAQIDTTQSINLLDEFSNSDNENMDLLPEKFLFTQRIMWGKKGLMRNFNRFELTPEKRQNELKVRRAMLVTHQALGFATLGGMIAQELSEQNYIRAIMTPKSHMKLWQLGSISGILPQQDCHFLLLPKCLMNVRATAV